MWMRALCAGLDIARAKYMHYDNSKGRLCIIVNYKLMEENTMGERMHAAQHCKRDVLSWRHK